MRIPRSVLASSTSVGGQRHLAAISLHFHMYYNFVRVHQTLRITPASSAFRLVARNPSSPMSGATIRQARCLGSRGGRSPAPLQIVHLITQHGQNTENAEQDRRRPNEGVKERLKYGNLMIDISL